jgi:transcriptional regulator with XRE-family HTH domain
MEVQAIRDILAKNIKYFRYHRKLSQFQLAEKADISVTFLSNIERGKMFPKVETLSRLTESLDVEVQELFQSDLASDDHKKMMNRLTEDITRNVNQAMAEVLKLYSE